jgi:hypothetical protein
MIREVNMAEVTISDKEYMDVLDEIYGTVSICGISYCAGYALFNIDPIAFGVAKSDYEASLEADEEA